MNLEDLPKVVKPCTTAKKLLPSRDSFEVFQSAEFQALLKYLGVDCSTRRTMDMTIVLEMDKPCIVVEKYQAARTEQPKAIETTSLHNTTMRTKQPPTEKPR